MSRGSWLVFSMVMSILCTVTIGASFLDYGCGKTGEYTIGSTYHKNLVEVSHVLANSSTGPFTTTIVGSIPNMVYGGALCRGDLNLSDCIDCIGIAFQDAAQMCTGKKEACMYYDQCIVQFSNQKLDPSSFSGTERYTFYENINQDELSPELSQDFHKAIVKFVTAVGVQASINSSKFCTGVGGFQSLLGANMYALAQCDTVITPEECRSCLDWLLEGSYLNQNKTDVRACNSYHCSYGYSKYPFFSGQPIIQLPEIRAPPSSPGGTRGREDKKNTPTIIAIIVAVLLLVVVLLVAFIVIRGKRKGAEVQLGRPIALREQENVGDSVSFCEFDLSILAAATNNFSVEIGSGGFGPVYKGRLQGGADIAVKRARDTLGRGVHQFRNEINLIRTVQHKNLIRLLGYCVHGNEAMFLVYEYMPNGSLASIIFDEQRGASLNCAKRLEIIEGIAQGIKYLHTDSRAGVQIVHRDLKADNILLDENMTPKISDFGLSKRFRPGTPEANNRRSFVGTPGYMCPEYTRMHIFTTKSDVYNFGVLVLEIISGTKKNSFTHTNGSGSASDSGFVNLINYAWQLWAQNRVSELVEPKLGNIEEPEMDLITNHVKLALLCVQDSANDRPTMAVVTTVLATSHFAGLPDPKRPSQLPPSATPRRLTHNNTSANIVTISSSMMEGR